MLPRQVRIGAGIGLVAVAAARVAGAQELVLRIRPHAGDTLRMRLDQETDVTGTDQTGIGLAPMVSTLAMFARAIIEGSTDAETAVLAVTDSVKLWTNDQRGWGIARQVEEQLRGQRVHFRVTPEGLVATEPSSSAPREVSRVVSLMPATFPKGPIKVGDTWMRDMPLPSGTQFGARLSGLLHATFRLDSLGRAGDLAFLSMRGVMSPAAVPGVAAGPALEKGTVAGRMILDRRRGWLSESWFDVVVVTSSATAPSASAVKMQTKITQHMRTAERHER